MISNEKDKTQLIEEVKQLKKRLASLESLIDNQGEGEKEHLESKELLEFIINNIPNKVFWKNRDLVYMGCNQAFAEVMGMKCPAEVIGKTDYDFHRNTAYADSYRAWDKKIMDTGEAVLKLEELYHTSDGEEGTVLTSKVPLRDNHGNVFGILGICTDITDSKRLEASLEKSEKRYGELFDNINNCVAVYEGIKNGTDFIFIDFNKAAEKAEKIQKVDLIGKSVLQVFPAIKEFGLFDVFQRVWKTEKPEHHSISVYKDDRIAGWRENYVYKLPSGEIVAVYQDMTDQKRNEMALRDSENLYRTFFEKGPDGVVILDPQSSKILKFNNQACWQLGYTPDEFALLKLTDIEVEETAKEVQAHIHKVVKDRYDDFETCQRTKQGEIRNVHVTAQVIETAKGDAYHCIWRDITDRKRAEDKLRESENRLARSRKMESLGLLAGGVAHDLNNVLGGIVSYPELLLASLPKDSELKKPLETIRSSGHRAAAIVKDLLTIAKGVATTKEPLRLNDIIKDYLKSPEFQQIKQSQPSVHFDTKLANKLLNIKGSQVHIRKVLMNLVSNASEAIENNGKVVISTMNRYLGRPLWGYEDVTIGEYAVLSVSDNGSGISKDAIERLFEPFFTRKILGRSGTGLGLSIVWNIVHDHDGYINVVNDEDGTKFELYFPVTRDEIPNKALPLSIKDYRGNGETILVVDDIENQREISCKMLDVLGYAAKALSSGEEAIEYLKSKTVDLVLLDMIMDPGISGRETYERILKIHPGQKAIIASGFAETDEVTLAKQLGADIFLVKPVTLEELAVAVRNKLDQK